VRAASLIVCHPCWGTVPQCNNSVGLSFERRSYILVHLEIIIIIMKYINSSFFLLYYYYCTFISNTDDYSTFSDKRMNHCCWEPKRTLFAVNITSKKIIWSALIIHCFPLHKMKYFPISGIIIILLFMLNIFLFCEYIILAAVYI